MGIRFLCPACGKKVHVKDHQAGLRGFCPKCQAKIDIPQQSTLPGKRDRRQHADAAAAEEPQAAELVPGAAGEQTIAAILPHVGRLLGVHAQPPVDPLSELSGAQWYVVPPEGTDPFGPADGPTMGSWIQQGRVVSRSLVWRDDWANWRKAGTVWSHLALADTDPRRERFVEQARATAPQFSSPQVPTMRRGTPTQEPAAAESPRSMLPQAVVASVPTAVPAAAPAAMYRTGLPMAVPAAQPPAVPASAAPSTDRPGDELYYPRRSNALYLSIVGLLLLGLVGLSVVLFYVLDRIQLQKQRATPPAAGETVTDGAAPAGTGS